MRKISTISDPTLYKGREIKGDYIVDTGGYVSNSHKITSMINSGLALSIVRQQLTYGENLDLMPPVVRLRYLEKMEVLAKADEMTKQQIAVRNKLISQHQKSTELANSVDSPKESSPDNKSE